MHNSSDIGVISTRYSPFAKLHDVPIHAVTLGHGFWRERFEANKEKGIPSFMKQLERVGARDKLLGRKNKARGNSDADLAKWMEAVAFVLQSEDDSQLKKILDSVIDEILLSNAEDGYLNTRYLRRMPENLASLESSGYLYCLGHLIQAAIAYYRATGEKKLLNLFIRYIDDVTEKFGYGKQQCWTGHPEIEMALVELYRTTGEKKYLNFADYLLNGVDLRKIKKVSHIDFLHTFTGIPFKSRKELSDHAVCAMYVCCGATDYYLETGHGEIWQTLESLWNDLTQYKMYVTGGLGSRPPEEAIGSRYELPNERAYAETCAAIGNIMWNWRLLNASGEARFADIIELALYNGFLSSVSLEGVRYFYWNPLLSRADVPETRENDSRSLIAIGR